MCASATVQVDLVFISSLTFRRVHEERHGSATRKAATALKHSKDSLLTTSPLHEWLSHVNEIQISCAIQLTLLFSHKATRRFSIPAISLVIYVLLLAVSLTLTFHVVWLQGDKVVLLSKHCMQNLSVGEVAVLWGCMMHIRCVVHIK